MSSVGYNSSNYEMARAIAVDASHNVYVAGASQALMIGTTPVGTKGGFDVFITRTNANGSLQWVREVGGSGDDNVVSMDLDNLGNLFLSGNFFGTDFDVNPTAAVYTFSAGGPNTNSFLLSMFVTGTFNWGNNWGSNLVDDYGEAITAASNGETFQAANFGNSIESIALRDATGAGVWGVPSTGATFLSVQSLDCDASYNVYMAGNLVGSMTWNGPSLGSAGSNDIYVAKWNGLSTQQWQFRLGGVGSDAAYEIAIGPNNTVFIAGVFSGNVDFNPSGATNNLTSVGGTDIFIMRLGATTVGLDEPTLFANSFYAYPNPVSDVLTISFSKTVMKESTLRLFSMDGKCVLSNDISVISDQEYLLNTSSLPAGMYVLDVQQGEKHEQQKVLKFE
ncbi:MAG: T9SS type A sorting domain-containing protein [Bacteroidetes bacterium]|nr:T9SS type A sorting domain-containing protein [Bacteroidota bacterium]